ncbi:MAG: hypothetical protein OEZ01_06305 [Candidatus Heimdallarchaeota archaeon]|nr:hypothetical protein [Candidatus Heimdallarchaeota archaeon]MDH5645600.1 hypothetical protein [Candidatus Heimdallarchaeota archaeon]
MEVIQNGVHVISLIIEGLCSLTISYLVYKSFKKYQIRKNQPTFDLSVSFLNFGIAIWLIALGKYFDFFSSYDAITERSYSDLGLNLSFIFLALANIWLAKFVTLVFMKDNSKFLVYYAVLNGITIGLFLPYVNTQPGSYRSLMLYVVFHVMISIPFYIMIVNFCNRESKNTTEKLGKVGFRLISLFAVFLMLIFVFTGLDSVLTEYNIGTEITGLTIAYYLLWVCTLLSIFFGYLGYMMPDWLRKRLSD